MKRIPVIFLDRDGVINKSAKPHEYITSWADFEVLSGVCGALRLFEDNGFKIFIVTNQRCVSRGMASLEEINALHAKMTEYFALNGCRVDGIFICPHGNSDECACRKPKPGLLIQVQKRLEESCSMTVDKPRSCMIGDSKTDGMKHLTAENILDSARKILDFEE